MDEDVSEYELIHGDDIQLDSLMTAMPNEYRVSAFPGTEEREQLVDDYPPTDIAIFPRPHDAEYAKASPPNDYLPSSLGKRPSAAVPLDHRALFMAMNSFQSDAIFSMKEDRALTNGILTPADNLSEDRRKQLSKVGAMANECIELVKRNRIQNEMESRSDPNSLCVTFNVIPIKKRKVRSNPREWRILYHNLTRDQCI